MRRQVARGCTSEAAAGLAHRCGWSDAQKLGRSDAQLAVHRHTAAHMLCAVYKHTCISICICIYTDIECALTRAHSHTPLARSRSCSSTSHTRCARSCGQQRKQWMAAVCLVVAQAAHLFLTSHTTRVIPDAGVLLFMCKGFHGRSHYPWATQHIHGQHTSFLSAWECCGGGGKWGGPGMHPDAVHAGCSSSRQQSIHPIQTRTCAGCGPIPSHPDSSPSTPSRQGPVQAVDPFHHILTAVHPDNATPRLCLQ